MKPVYAITSNTEISYGETFSFLRYKIYILENNSCSKIYHVKKKFFSVVQYKIMFLFHITVTWARNRIHIVFLSFLLSFYLEFRYLNLTKLIIETLNKIVIYTTSWNLRKGSEIWYRLMIEVKVHVVYNQIEKKIKNISYFIYYLRV
jgi:hypothetical protein